MNTTHLTALYAEYFTVVSTFDLRKNPEGFNMEGKNFCIFGDSVGKGVTLGESGRYKTTVLDVKQLTGRSDVHVDNYSRFGFIADKVLSLLRKCTQILSSHDAVFLEVGGNDCDYDWAAISENPGGVHLCKTPPEEFREKYASALELVRKSGCKPYALSLPPIVPEKYFKRISEGKNADNILLWLGSVDTMYRWQEMYNGIVTCVTREMDVPLLDIRSAFLCDHHYEKYFCDDGIHPNDEGYKLIYSEVVRQYRKLTA